jgi:hypothetical protein
VLGCYPVLQIQESKIRDLSAPALGDHRRRLIHVYVGMNSRFFCAGVGKNKKTGEFEEIRVEKTRSFHQ